MTISKIPLRTLLAHFGLPPDKRLSAVRADARAEIRKQSRPSSNGGDFHSCFWSDAKAHSSGQLDLLQATQVRISELKARSRLYPLLAQGFLHWWNEKRRWVNEPISVLPETVKAPYTFHEIGGIVKIDNMLALSIGESAERLIYPYFAESPHLNEETARLGLWLMGEALPNHSISDMRILDVIRANTFSVDRYPLTGREGAQFVERYAAMLHDWRRFIAEFS